MESDKQDIIFGRNTVKEAVRHSKSMDKILVGENLNDGSIKEILKLAYEKNYMITKVKKQKLDELCMPFGHGGRSGNHQGILAFVPAFEYADIEDIFNLAKEKDEPPFIIILDGITDPNNLGSIIRSAENFGVHGVIMGKRRSAPLNTAVHKISSGAAQYIPVVKEVNLNSTLKELKKRGIWTAAAVIDGQTAFKTDLKGALAIVIGSEGKGISRLLQESCDYRVKIDMKGSLGSLNASVAAAVLMYEKTRQESESK